MPNLRVRAIAGLIGFAVTRVLSIGVTPHALGGGGDTSLIHACVGRLGFVRIVAPGGHCGRHETSLHWPATPAPQERGGLTLIDSQGQFVGFMIDQTNVVRDVGGVWYRLAVRESGFALNNRQTVAAFYKSPNCTGPRYVDSAAPGELFEHAFAFHDVIIGTTRGPRLNFCGSIAAAEDPIGCGGTPRDSVQHLTGWFEPAECQAIPPTHIVGPGASEGPGTVLQLPVFTPPFRVAE